VILRITDTAGNPVGIDVSATNVALGAAVGSAVTIECDKDYWSGNERSLTLGAYLGLLEGYIEQLQARIGLLKRQCGDASRPPRKRITFEKRDGDVVGATIGEL
jgi:hypothetical protein